MKCKMCHKEVVKAKWYHYFIFFPFSIIYKFIMKMDYVHKDKYWFHNCRGILLHKKLIY